MDTRAATIRERFGRFRATEEPPGILPRTPRMDLLTSPMETDAEQESIILREKERKGPSSRLATARGVGLERSATSASEAARE